MPFNEDQITDAQLPDMPHHRGDDPKNPDPVKGYFDFLGNMPSERVQELILAYNAASYENETGEPPSAHQSSPPVTAMRSAESLHDEQPVASLVPKPASPSAA